MITMNNMKLDDSLFLPESYNKIDILDECYDMIINEDITSNVLSTTTTYTYSLIAEVLENVKNILLNLYQRILSSLNNYILNNAKLIEKYRDLIKVRLNKLEKPITYSYYQYNETKDYPNILHPGFIEKHINNIQRITKNDDNASIEIENIVNDTLRYFSKEIIDSYVDVNNLKSSTNDIVTKKIRGRKITKVLNEADVDNFITEISAYKKDKEDLVKTKDSIIADYQVLKRSYKGAFIEEMPIDKTKLLLDKNAAEIEARARSQFATINMQTTRMFNGFITIYQVAFNTKLNLLTEKIENNRAIIIELLKQTSILGAVNTKDVKNSNKKQYTYEPKLKL